MLILKQVLELVEEGGQIHWFGLLVGANRIFYKLYLSVKLGSLFCMEAPYTKSVIFNYI